MAEETYLKQLTMSLRDERQRWLLSMTIDELERETYWKTRQDILRIVKRKIDEGDLKYIDYMMNKEKPL